MCAFCRRHGKSVSCKLYECFGQHGHCVVSFDFMEISAAHYFSVNNCVCTLSGLHGLATGLKSNHVEPEDSFERFPGAGESVAEGQPPAWGTDSWLGCQKHLTLPGLVPTGTDCEGSSCPGQVKIILLWYTTYRQGHKAKVDNDYVQVLFHYNWSGPSWLAENGLVCITKQQWLQ